MHSRENNASCLTFIHEAAHAMVYNALDVPVRSLRIEISRLGAPSGKTQRFGDISLDKRAAVLEFMAGAAAIIGICGLGFEDKLHTFTSDICVLLRHKPQLNMRLSEEEKSMVLLARYRLAAEHFVRDWVIQYRRPILRLAAALMKAGIAENGYELEGDDLTAAMSSAWRGNKPSARETEAFAREGWDKLPQEVTINLEWQARILNVCKIGC